MNTARLRRRLWLHDAPGKIADIVRRAEPAPERDALFYLPPGFELTVRNLNEHAVRLTL